MKMSKILKVMNKINILSLGGLQTIVKTCAGANLSFDGVFFHEN